MRRYNQFLYRVTRANLPDDREAQDVMQDACVRAYQDVADSNCPSPSLGLFSPSLKVSIPRQSLTVQRRRYEHSAK